MFKCSNSGWLSEMDDVLYHAPTLIQAFLKETGNGITIGAGHCENCGIMGVSVSYTPPDEDEEKEFTFTAPVAIEIGRRIMDVGFGQKDMQFVGAMLQVVGLGIVTASAQEAETKIAEFGYGDIIANLFDSFEAIKDHAEERGDKPASDGGGRPAAKGRKKGSAPFGEGTMKSLARKLSGIQRTRGKDAAKAIFEAIKAAATSSPNEETRREVESWVANHGIISMRNRMAETQLDAIADRMEQEKADGNGIGENGTSIALSTGLYPKNADGLEDPKEIDECLQSAKGITLFAVSVDVDDAGEPKVKHTPLGVFEFGQAYSQFSDDLERYLIETMRASPQTSKWLNMLRSAGVAFAKQPMNQDDLRRVADKAKQILDTITAANDKKLEFHVSLDGEGMPVVVAADAPEDRTIN